MTEDFWNWAKVAKYRQSWSHWLSCSRVNSQRFATFRSHWNKASTNSTYLGGRYSSVVSSAHTIVQTQGSNPKQTIYTIFSSYCWNLSCAYYCKEKRTKINEKEACDWPIFWKSSTHLSFLLLSNLFEHFVPVWTSGVGPGLQAGDQVALRLEIEIKEDCRNKYWYLYTIGYGFVLPNPLGSYTNYIL